MHYVNAQLLKGIKLGLVSNTDPEQVSTIAKLIHDYGAEVVIIAVFLIILGGILYVFMRMLSNLNKNTIAQNEKVLSSILDMIKTQCNENKKMIEQTKEEKAAEEKADKEIITKGVENNKIISEAAKLVIGELRCDRVAANSFHNGNHTHYGYHFVKMSCIIEQAMPNSNVYRGNMHKGMPISPFSSIIDSLIKNDEYMVGNIYNHGIMTANQHIISFTESTNIKALFAMSVKDEEGNIAGFVIAEFKDEKDFSSRSFYDKTRSIIRDFAATVRPIIISNECKDELKK